MDPLSHLLTILLLMYPPVPPRKLSPHIPSPGRTSPGRHSCLGLTQDTLPQSPGSCHTWSVDTLDTVDNGSHQMLRPLTKIPRTLCHTLSSPEAPGPQSPDSHSGLLMMSSPQLLPSRQFSLTPPPGCGEDSCGPAVVESGAVINLKSRPINPPG